jgi:putative PIN family toxin of toxin-antitoxin system
VLSKPRVILDSSVVVSGIGWRGGDARKVLTLLALDGFQSYRTPWLTAEWSETVQYGAEHEKRWKNPNWINWLDWLKRASKLEAEIPVRKTVKRDPKDDPVVMAAVAVRAAFIITSDDDLLALKKPYGTICLRPREFLGVLLRQP